MFVLSALSLVVGALIGVVGVGGVLLIPAMQHISGLDIHVASATALFSFVFSGVMGTVLFGWRKSIHWQLAIPICIGGLLFSVVGAWVSAHIQSHLLTQIIAGVILFSGVAVFATQGKTDATSSTGHLGLLSLFVVGAVCGFCSGLSGAGGPVFLVPALLFLGFPALISIGAGQVLQLVSALSGSSVNLINHTIDFGFAAAVTPLLLLGVIVGVHYAHSLPTQALRRLAGALCIVVGCLMIFHT